MISGPKQTRFHDLVAMLIADEGGARFVNHPKDPGGATKYGITMRTLRKWRDRPTTVQDVRDLTEKEARRIYLAEYWNVMRCDDLPPGLDYMVFDFGVNAGPTRAANFLQTILARQVDPSLEIDGAIGPLTARAAGAARRDSVIEEFHRAKMRHYEGQDHKDDFLEGWTARAHRVLAQARAMAGYRPEVGA